MAVPICLLVLVSAAAVWYQRRRKGAQWYNLPFLKPDVDDMGTVMLEERSVKRHGCGKAVEITRRTEMRDKEKKIAEHRCGREAEGMCDPRRKEAEQPCGKEAKGIQGKMQAEHDCS